jgi:hypothetical protein
MQVSRLLSSILTRLRADLDLDAGLHHAVA